MLRLPSRGSLVFHLNIFNTYASRSRSMSFRSSKRVMASSDGVDDDDAPRTSNFRCGQAY
jgi:hypothetical protein